MRDLPFSLGLGKSEGAQRTLAVGRAGPKGPSEETIPARDPLSGEWGLLAAGKQACRREGYVVAARRYNWSGVTVPAWHTAAGRPILGGPLQQWKIWARSPKMDRTRDPGWGARALKGILLLEPGVLGEGPGLG